MRTRILYIMLVAAVGGGMESALSYAAEQVTNGDAASAQRVTGQVVMFTPDFIVIKGADGKSVHVMVGKDAKMSGPVKEGDQVEAELSSDGQAKAITVVPAPK